MDESEIVTLVTYQSETEALLAKGVLDEAGIPSMVRADNVGGMYPAMGRVQLLVAAEDADRARDALEAR